MPFWKYKQEAERLGQEDGLGKWKDRKLEVTSHDSRQPQQPSASPVCHTAPFSQRKAKDKGIQEVSNLTPTPSPVSPVQSNSEQHDTNHNRPRDNVSTSTQQEGHSGSSKPSQQPFSSKYKCKRQS